MTQIEEWRKITHIEGFSVSNQGRIRSDKTGTILLFSTHPKGYKYLSLKGKRRSVHRIVAIIWVGNPHKKGTVNHKDFNKANNSASNLEWLTHAENVEHCKLSLNSYSNFKNRWKREDAICAIKLHFVYGLCRIELMRIFNRPYGSVRKVLTQKHLFTEALTL